MMRNRAPDDHRDTMPSEYRYPTDGYSTAREKEYGLGASWAMRQERRDADDFYNTFDRSEVLRRPWQSTLSPRSQFPSSFPRRLAPPYLSPRSYRPTQAAYFDEMRQFPPTRAEYLDETLRARPDGLYNTAGYLNASLPRDMIAYEQQGAWEAMTHDDEMRRRYGHSTWGTRDHRYAWEETAREREMSSRYPGSSWRPAAGWELARERDASSRYPGSSWGPAVGLAATPAAQQRDMAREFQHAQDEIMRRQQEQSMFQHAQDEIKVREQESHAELRDMAECRERYEQALYQRELVAREQYAVEDMAQASDTEMNKWYQRATRQTSPRGIRRCATSPWGLRAAPTARPETDFTPWRAKE